MSRGQIITWCPWVHGEWALHLVLAPIQYTIRDARALLLERLERQISVTRTKSGPRFVYLNRNCKVCFGWNEDKLQQRTGFFSKKSSHAEHRSIKLGEGVSCFSLDEPREHTPKFLNPVCLTCPLHTNDALPSQHSQTQVPHYSFFHSNHLVNFDSAPRIGYGKRVSFIAEGFGSRLGGRSRLLLEVGNNLNVQQVGAATFTLQPPTTIESLHLRLLFYAFSLFFVLFLLFSNDV